MIEEESYCVNRCKKYHPKKQPKKGKKKHRHRYKADEYGWVQCSCGKIKSFPDYEMHIAIAKAYD